MTKHHERLGPRVEPANIDQAARVPTERLAYIYDTYIQPALAPIERLLDHLADRGRTRPISLRAFHFLIAHGGAAPFTLVPLARHFDPATRATPAPSPNTPSSSRP